MKVDLKNVIICIVLCILWGMLSAGVITGGLGILLSIGFGFFVGYTFPMIKYKEED